MQRRLRALGTALSCVCIGFAATACQAEGDDATDATDAAAIEEPAPVTDATDDPDPTDESNDESTGDESADDPSTADQPADDGAPTPSTLVLATPAPDKTSTQPGPIEPSTDTVYEVGLIDRGLTPFVDRAVDDLATRLEIEPDSIEVLTAVLVTWPDGSLGCPEPDMIYATVLTDGSVIELGVDDLVYRYHSGGDRPPFPCDRPLDPAPEPVVGGSS